MKKLLVCLMGLIFLCGLTVPVEGQIDRRREDATTMPSYSGQIWESPQNALDLDSVGDALQAQSKTNPNKIARQLLKQLQNAKTPEEKAEILEEFVSMLNDVLMGVIELGDKVKAKVIDALIGELGDENGKVRATAAWALQRVALDPDAPDEVRLKIAEAVLPLLADSYAGAWHYAHGTFVGLLLVGDSPDVKLGTLSILTKVIEDSELSNVAKHQLVSLFGNILMDSVPDHLLTWLSENALMDEDFEYDVPVLNALKSLFENQELSPLTKHQLIGVLEYVLDSGSLSDEAKVAVNDILVMLYEPDLNQQVLTLLDDLEAAQTPEKKAEIIWGLWMILMNDMGDLSEPLSAETKTKVIDAIIGQLGDENARVRKAAVWALHSIVLDPNESDEFKLKVAEAVLPLFADPDMQDDLGYVEQTLLGLIHVGDSPTLDVKALAILRDVIENSELSDGAINQIKRAVLAGFKPTNTNDKMDYYVQTLVLLLGVDGAAEALVGMLDNASADMREGALLGLAKILSYNMMDFGEVLSAEVRAEVIDTLIGELDSDHAGTRKAAVRGLSCVAKNWEVSDEVRLKAAEAVLPLLADPDENVRLYATEALMGLLSPHADRSSPELRALTLGILKDVVENSELSDVTKDELISVLTDVVESDDFSDQVKGIANEIIDILGGNPEPEPLLAAEPTSEYSRGLAPIPKDQDVRNGGFVIDEDGNVIGTIEEVHIEFRPEPKPESKEDFSVAEIKAQEYLADALGVDIRKVKIIGSEDITPGYGPTRMLGADHLLVTFEYEGKEYYVTTTKVVYPGAEWSNFEEIAPGDPLIATVKAREFLAKSLGVDKEAIRIIGSENITPDRLVGAEWRLVTLEYEGKEYLVTTSIGIYPGAEWGNFAILEEGDVEPLPISTPGPFEPQPAPMPGPEPNPTPTPLIPVYSRGLGPVPDSGETEVMPAADAFGWYLEESYTVGNRGTVSRVREYVNLETGERIKIVKTTKTQRGNSEEQASVVTTTLVYENADGVEQEVVINGAGTNWEMTDELLSFGMGIESRVREYTNSETGEKFTIRVDRSLIDGSTSVTWRYTNADGEVFAITFEAGTMPEDLFAGITIVEVGPIPGVLEIN